ncbi:MAG: D-glutamate deacylase [Acidobacteria bacterium]|nr:MAG: D-glutamate deacylase [Acidobacteriota bacterium]PYV04000.1 MAG: D-glutamate deacylase [Acidobacteriota bacterium]PYV41380.1 MAG: D-glutamate deacylase [Acidobacteriota bacterium]
MLVTATFALLASFQAPYDLVIQGGRVMDPETGLDAVMNVGIRGGSIVRLSTERLRGARTIDARGLIVAPGFIDLHSHGQDAENYRLKALDGVTTALEMEIGVPDVASFLAERRGRALIHFGATASHPFARVKALGGAIVPGAIVPASSPATQKPVAAEQLAPIKDLLRKGLEAGALGIGMGIAYTPGATRFEVIEMFRLAAQHRVPVFTHVRSSGGNEPGSSIESVGEVIAASAVSGASLHIVHINSSGLKDAPECLRLVEGARARGLDVTTEAYPYIAGMTAVNSAIFDPGWQDRIGVSYQDLQLVETGERLTKDRFEQLHGMTEPKLVLIFQNTDEMVDSVIAHPLVMIASDGHIQNGKGHPRGAGTYARILSRHVRSQQRLTMMDALRKMSLMPAQRLERATAAARKKGRLQEGADADIVVFDPRSVTDRATYESPAQPSSGFKYVLVSGTPVVEEGKIVENVTPGRALVRE